ncbi:hypothetical protein [Pseudomonas sp. FG-3G]|nr:hypothetical protein [Pseudomonas sp. FG-3G]
MRSLNGKKLVGASLLAIAINQSTLMLADPTLSRAGSLPQVLHFN